MSEAKVEKTPVTVLTGYLGAGKTTLLNRILTEDLGKIYAVIINESGEVGIDNELVVNADEEIFEMNNGCISDPEGYRALPEGPTAIADHRPGPGRLGVGLHPYLEPIQLTMFDIIKADLQRNLQDYAPAGRLKRIALGLTLTSTQALMLLRFQFWCARHRLPTIFAAKVLFWFFKIEISSRATIGPGLRLPHPLGLIIAPNVTVGANCDLYADVRLVLAHGSHGKVRSSAIMSSSATARNWWVT